VDGKYDVFGFARRDFSLSPHPARSKAARIIGNHRIVIGGKSARNKLDSANRQVASDDDRGIGRMHATFAGGTRLCYIVSVTYAHLRISMRKVQSDI
jgi:hypothetical protein